MKKKELIKKKPIDWISVENILQSILNEKIKRAPSLKGISRELGIDQSQLRAKYPELVRNISGNYLKSKKSLNVRNKKIIRNRIKAAVIKFHRLGIYPSANRVAKELGRPAIMLQKELHSYWKQQLRQLGYHEG
ncbi:hypothetical protein [Brevibacillus parabrevis]|uniref:hypothetical protein n=1 Tax=Brevibacillus parabrevis TaxID=54914 RepID=UPI0028D6D3DF|nr:hypothetical protein [Brevibacillus parabrevis]